MSHLCVCHTCLIYVCVIPHPYAWHASFMCVTCLPTHQVTHVHVMSLGMNVSDIPRDISHIWARHVTHIHTQRHDMNVGHVRYVSQHNRSPTLMYCLPDNTCQIGITFELNIILKLTFALQCEWRVKTSSFTTPATRNLVFLANMQIRHQYRVVTPHRMIYS